MNMLLVLLKGMGGRNMLLVLGEGRRVSQMLQDGECMSTSLVLDMGR